MRKFREPAGMGRERRERARRAGERCREVMVGMWREVDLCEGGGGLVNGIEGVENCCVVGAG